MCGICNVWVCVRVGLCVSVGVCMCGFCKVWVCVCLVYVKCGCVCVGFVM